LNFLSALAISVVAVFRREHLYWQRPHLHGKNHCRSSEGAYARFSGMPVKGHFALHDADAAAAGLIWWLFFRG
jgi:hypothetical protein